MRGFVLLLLLSMIGGLPGQALAHAALIEASPDDGAALTSSPEEVRLRFDEPVDLIRLGLVGPQGAVTPLRAAAVAGDVLSARFPPGLPRGTYLLSWRVTSVDSHPVAGTIAFGVGVLPDAARTSGTERWLLPSMAVRGAFLAALLVAAGAGLFRIAAEPPWRPALAWVAWAGVALAALQIGLRGALLADTPGVWSAGVWALGGRSTLGVSLAVSAAGLACCALALLAPRRGWGVVAGAAAGAAAVAGLALSGHVATADPRWLTAPALALHGLAAAFWIGALVSLHGLLRRGGVDALRRFSAAATAAVALLLLSGAALAAVQMESLTGLLSAYGKVLLLKLAAVAGLLGFAAWNRWRLMPALITGGPAKRLRVSIGCELALAAAVLAATGVLGLTPPPRAQARPRADLAAWTKTDGIEATIAVAPGHPGRNRFTVGIARANPPLEVTLELRLAAAGVAPIRRPMWLVDGDWVYEGPELAVPGRWTLRAEALLTEFDQTSFTTEMDIR